MPFTDAPCFVVHTLEHVRCVLRNARERNVPVVLKNATETVRALGPAWFSHLTRHAREEFPDSRFLMLYCCDDAPGFALSALRLGIEALEISDAIPKAAASALISAAQQIECPIMKSGPALDLLSCRNPDDACRQRLETGVIANTTN